MTMNIANLTKLPPVETGYIEDSKRPVIPFYLEVRDAGCAASHAHPRGQLIYASSGTMRVICGRDVLVVPFSQAVWVPPYVEHEVYFPGEVTLRNLFIDHAFVGSLPVQCTVLEVSPLLRELILKASAEDYDENSAEYRLTLVIIDELSHAESTDLRLPIAGDERLLRVINGLLENPGDTRSLAEWARTAGASSRTLARLFVSGTGLTFCEWKTRLRLQTAIDRLAKGDDVTAVAFDLGYSSLSAFIKMFREAMGSPPGRFARKK